MRPALGDAAVAGVGNARRRLRVAGVVDAVGRRVVRGIATRLVRRDVVLGVTGLDHVPATGPLLLVARHVHHLYDGAVLLAAVPRALRIMVGLDWVHGRAQRLAMEAATTLARWPVVLRTDALTVGPDGDARNTRGAFRSDEVQRYQLRAMRTGLELLVAGGALVVFPEAFPSVDPGWTPKTTLDAWLPFRRGFASLAAMARDHRALRVPIVPVGLAYRALAPTGAAPRWHVEMAFGAPVELLPGITPSALIADVESRVVALSTSFAPPRFPERPLRDAPVCELRPGRTHL